MKKLVSWDNEVQILYQQKNQKRIGLEHEPFCLMIALLGPMFTDNSQLENLMEIYVGSG
jgi:hypothetical protein